MQPGMQSMQPGMPNMQPGMPQGMPAQPQPGLGAPAQAQGFRPPARAPPAPSGAYPNGAAPGPAAAPAPTAGLPASWGGPGPPRTAASARAADVPHGRAVVGGELDAIQHALGGLLEQVAPQEAHNPVAVRKRQDIQKRLEELYARLQAGQVKDVDTEQVQAFANAVAAQDFATANSIHMKLSKGDWNSNRNWLMGLKRLLPR